MRVVLHAGLHKSGTTSIQESWKRAYGDHPEVWYPEPRRGPPGHHRLFRPLLGAFVDGTAPDLLGLSVGFHARERPRETLAEVLASCTRSTLLLSTEDLDRARSGDRPRLQAALGSHDVTLVLTLTRPTHRWCSGWQTLVKHGLATYPADSAGHVLGFAALEPGRVEELTRLIPATRVVVRLVRHAPPEPDLAAALARSLGLPDADRAVAPPVLNASLGAETEVLLRINRADLGLGLDRAGQAALERLRAGGLTHREAPELAARYAVPAAVAEAAAVEERWLASLPGLLDPHGLLASWTDASLPGWYLESSRREAVLPELDDAPDRETQLWRARQERSAYRKLAGI